MKLKDLKAKNYLFSSIDKSILKTITKKETLKQLWDSIKIRYQGNVRVQRAQLNRLRRDFEILAMKTGESVTSYFGRVLVVANEMRNYGKTMEDVKIVEKILRTLTDKWNFVKFKRSHDDEDIQALKVTFDDSRGSRGRGRFSPIGRRIGRARTMQSRDMIECYKCHKLGHYQFECSDWNKETNYAVVNNNEGDEEREMLLMAYISEVMKIGDGWFLDSGCSNHMSGDRSWFITLDQNHSTTVKLGNNMVMKTAGQGNIKIRMNGVNHIVPDVYYVPELRNNLLSMGQLQERGLAILIKGGLCKNFHSHKGLIIETEMSTNRMFMIHAELPANSNAKEENCLITKGKALSQLWHRRLGHLSYIMLKQLWSKGMVQGLPSIENVFDVCKDFLVGKHHREPFPSKSTWRTNKLLELVHADLCEPISLTSNGDKRYTLCFIDDFSRKGWVYFLTKKSEAFYYFKCFKKLVEKQTASYTAQQNGVSERKNRTLLNMARAVLSDQGMPKRFWAEAVNWSNYVLNRCPNAALKDITPEEA
nr:retrovirus-related Pol polyprotein from transposon TNT 1-94 [Tanacetum cinerariifolium]